MRLYSAALGVAISQACYATGGNHERAVLLHCQIQSQFQGKRHIPFMAMDQEKSHGRVITWTLRAKQAPEHIREI